MRLRLPLRKNGESKDLGTPPSLSPLRWLPEMIFTDLTIKVARRVYVGNMSWQTSWQNLKDHFKTVGYGEAAARGLRSVASTYLFSASSQSTGPPCPSIT